MNTTQVLNAESTFGPPSEPVDIPAFITAAVQAKSKQFQNVVDQSTQEDYSVSDIRDSLAAVWNNPKFSAFITKNRGSNIASASAKPVKYRRPKHSQSTNEEPQVSTDIADIQNIIDAIPLTSWKIPPEATHFIRGSRNSDHNTLREVRASNPSDPSPTTPEAVLVITIHTKLVWSPSFVSRTSQHAVLASQTLADLFGVVPCVSNALSEEISEGDRVVGYEPQKLSKTHHHGCVTCVEGLLFGDDRKHEDYADKLLLHLTKTSRTTPTLKKATSNIHNTKFFSLPLRINEPYWFLHRGNCEHFFVVDQIRLHHPSDPPGFPLTLQISPSLLDLCRACAKVPAVWSVVGDVRLGESPCVLCGSCWKTMGPSKDGGVLVVPLVEDVKEHLNVLNE